MSKKALRIRVKQPTAHYRDHKVSQNEYIDTLELPPKTTIMGMLTYLCDRRLKSPIDIAVIGFYKSKEIEFSRGERISFWDDYRKFKKKVENRLSDGEYYDYYKSELAENSILNYEVLKDVQLTIYISTESNEEFQIIKNSLESPSKYMNIGRKEDFIIPIVKGVFVEEVYLEEKYISETKEAIKEQLKIMNSYIKVDLKDSSNDILSKGVLYALPSTYKDLEADKVDRKFIFSHYIYVDKEGIYPKNITVNIYDDGKKKEVFTWL